MREAFLRYSWGIFFILIDFRIGFLDVLPDFIGFILMWTAIDTLGRQRSGYMRAKPYVILLTLLSLVEIVPLLGEPGLKMGESIPMLVYGSFIMLLTLVMMNFFFIEISRHASDASAHYLAANANSRRSFFNLTSGALLVYMPFSINLSPITVITLTVLISLFSILSVILLGFTCRQAAKGLHLKGSDQ
jgi:hypothetical protein